MQAIQVMNKSQITVSADLQNEEAHTLSHSSRLFFVGIRPIRCLRTVTK